MSAFNAITNDQQMARQQLDTILQLANELASRAGVTLSSPAPGYVTGKRQIAGLLGYVPWAAQAYGERQLRHKYFGEFLFGEPGWDIMLDLFTQQHQQRQVSITSACIASMVPPTTALRWINVLISHGLAIRTGDAVDRRRAYVELTPAAFKKLHAYFGAVDSARSRGRSQIIQSADGQFRLVETSDD